MNKAGEFFDVEFDDAILVSLMGSGSAVGQVMSDS